jgi:hypothetical protein
MILAATLLASTVAQAQNGSEANHQSSPMTPPSGNTGPANNGPGTAGSLAHNAGSASSKASPSTIKTDGSNSGASGPKENDPALGGGAQSK